MRYKVAYATCPPDPAYPPDESARHFSPTAARHDIEIIAAQWDDPTIDWSAFDMVLLRSTWDYYMRLDAFLRWLDGLPVPVWNPPDLVRWNCHKKYLLELAQEFAVVPTHLIPRGSRVNLKSILDKNGWNEAVIKPAVANSAFNTFRVDVSHPDDARLNESLAHMDMLIQPFVPEIHAGEWSLMFFRDEFSHAVLKIPEAGDMRVQAEYGGRTFAQQPPDALIDDARRLLEAVDYPWLYARVDGVAREGHLLLMELELIEPELFLEHHPAAGDNFAAALRSILDA